MSEKDFQNIQTALDNAVFQSDYFIKLFKQQEQNSEVKEMARSHVKLLESLREVYYSTYVRRAKYKNGTKNYSYVDALIKPTLKDSYAVKMINKLNKEFGLIAEKEELIEKE